MKTFAFCVKPSVVGCLGPMFTGNCGCDRNILRKNYPAQCNMPRLPFLVRGRKIQFLEATASSFTKERLVLGVNLNILVFSILDGLHPGLKCNFRGQLRRDFPRSTHSAKSGRLPTPINLTPIKQLFRRHNFYARFKVLLMVLRYIFLVLLTPTKTKICLRL
jgi:hypothetical protein